MRKIIYIIISVISIALLVSLFVLFSQSRQQTPPPTPLITPTTVPIRIPTLAPANRLDPLKKFELVQLLPVSTPNFNIEYLATSDLFMITIKNSPLSVNRQAALNWFTEQGIDPTGLRIQYNIYRWVQ